MLSAHMVRALVEKASAAPSSHNTQPWQFRARGSTIDLLADRTRALPVNDPFDRELTISCGAALLSLRVAAASAGLATRTRLFPEGANSDWLARIEIVVGAADVDLARLAAALKRRRTYRKAFERRPVTNDAMLVIEQAVVIEGSALMSLDGESRGQVAGLVAEGDRQQWDDPRWRRELAMWMHPRRLGDGLTVPTLAVPIAQAVVRTFDMGNGVAARDQQLASASPWLTVLTTAEDDVLAWLRAGQALQRALLVGCRLGLQASYLNQPVQVAKLRARLQILLGTTAHPQLLIRWGHPTEEMPAASRRSVDAVLDLQAP
jgi:hypothetical protein